MDRVYPPPFQERFLVLRSILPIANNLSIGFQSHLTAMMELSNKTFKPSMHQAARPQPRQLLHMALNGMNGPHPC